MARTRFAVLAVASLSALALLAAPSGASAAVSFKYARKVVDLPASASKRIDSACPSTMHVVGGGGSQTEGSPLHLFSSSTFPYDGPDSDSLPDDGWSVRYTTYDRPERVAVTAVCASVLPHYSSLSYQVPVYRTYEHAPTCGGTRAILSGGYRSVPSVRTWETIPYDGGSSGDKWQLAVFNASGKTQAVTGYAICAHLDVAYVFDPSDFENGIDPQIWWNVDAGCPASHPTAVGGGFYSDADNQRGFLHVQDNFPFVGFSGFGVWRADVDNSHYPGDPALQGWGVCAAS